MTPSLLPMLTGSLPRRDCPVGPTILALLREVLPGEDFANAAGKSKRGCRRMRSGPWRAAELCKQYLRLKYDERLPWVEDFIVAMEETGVTAADGRWERLIDLDSITDCVLEPLDLEFERWVRT